MLVNPSHVLVHVRTVLRHVVAVDAPEAALAMIAAGPVMSHHAVLLYKAVGAMGTVEPAVIVGRGSTWKNRFRIRTVERTFRTLSCFQTLPFFENAIAFSIFTLLHTQAIQTHRALSANLEDILLVVVIGGEGGMAAGSSGTPGNMCEFRDLRNK